MAATPRAFLPVTNFRDGIWRLADPKISITSAASMAIGASLAAGHDRFSWWWLAVLGLAMFCMDRNNGLNRIGELACAPTQA